MKLIDETFTSSNEAKSLLVEIGNSHGAKERFEMQSAQQVIGDNEWCVTRVAVWLDPVFIQISHSKRIVE